MKHKKCTFLNWEIFCLDKIYISAPDRFREMSGHTHAEKITDTRAADEFLGKEKDCFLTRQRLGTALRKCTSDALKISALYLVFFRVLPLKREVWRGRGSARSGQEARRSVFPSQKKRSFIQLVWWATKIRRSGGSSANAAACAVVKTLLRSIIHYFKDKRIYVFFEDKIRIFYLTYWKPAGWQLLLLR